MEVDIEVWLLTIPPGVLHVIIRPCRQGFWWGRVLPLAVRELGVNVILVIVGYHVRGHFSDSGNPSQLHPPYSAWHL